ncbi:Ig-like domain-containing protein [Pantoea sp. GM01]|uniref:Ig-like domain-containing protein n=1 Tax=Pantoea sp. GM01 TaxID=1144320 RepID=UPI0002713B96|nr:Ig-like domain-containing protein [Pantoea sp. GM01]EJL91993.1 hypothetical protein PMI17_00834 [Pantoea sp. GM01]
MKINKLFDPIETVVVEFATGKIAFESREDARDPEEAGVVVHIIINDQHFSTIIEEDGNWHWTAPEDLPDGTYNAVMYNVDKGGLQSEDYTPLNIVVDSTPPDAPILHNLYDDVGGKVGSFDKGGTTDDKTPQLTGVAQKGSKVLLKNADGETIGSAVADKDSGEWVIIPTVELQDGTNSLTLTTVEKFAGQFRESAPSEAFVINVAPDADIGTLPPDTILINHAFDNAGTNTGILKNGALTDDDTPELRGFASAGSTVVVMYREVGSDSWTGSATATLSGEQWSWTPSAALSSGNYEFQASIGDTSSSLFTLEIFDPADYARSVRIVSAYDNAGSATGSLGNGAYTDDLTPTLRGRAEANSQVVVGYTLLNGTAASVTVDVNSQGNWSWTPETDLQMGNWSFNVKPKGASAWSDAFNLTLTDADSIKPTIDFAYDNVGDKGERSSGDTTDDLTPTLHGHGEPNSLIYLSAKHGSDPATIYSVKTNSVGEWNWTPENDLAQGGWKFEVRKEGATQWESAFDLKLKSGRVDGDYSTTIDFENQPNGEGPFYFDSGTLQITNASSSSRATIADLPSGPASFNKKALRLESNSAGALSLTFKNGGIGVGTKDTPTKFGIDFYNHDNRDAVVKVGIHYSDLNGNYIGLKYFGFNLRPGDVYTLTDNDFANLDENVHIGMIRIYPSSDVWIDNIKYGYPDSNTLNSIDSIDDDTIHTLSTIDDLTSSAIIGHEGQTDELYLTGHDQVLDLSAHSAEIQSIEVFDISGDGDNTLVVDINSLLQHGEKNLFIDDGKTQLLVRGDEGDTVQLKDILPEGSDVSEWVHQDGTVTVAGVEYNVYSHGDDAELLIQQGVKTELV